jgi:hypothetical protein
MNAASSSGAGESRGPLRDKPSEASAVTVLLAARVRGAGGGGAARMASRSDTARLAVRTSESPLVFRSLHFFPSHSYPRQRERLKRKRRGKRGTKGARPLVHLYLYVR